MGTITAGTLIDRAAIALSDVINVRWLRAELLTWLSEGQRQICILQPNANKSVAVTALVAGAKQALPSDCQQLLDVYANVAANGTTVGDAVIRVNRPSLDLYLASWRAATATAVVKNYVYEEDDRTTFWVYPPSLGTTYLQINYCKRPAALASEATAIEIDDSYEGPLLDWMLFRANCKPVDGSGGPQQAQLYYQAFTAAVGDRGTIQQQSDAGVGQ